VYTIQIQNIMFKSILPSKRVPSGEFTMLTPPLPAADGTATGGVLTPNHNNGNGVYGKENYFDSAVTTASPHGSPTKKKSGAAVRKSVIAATQSGGPDASPPYNNINLVNDTEMNVAFDKLLVSVFSLLVFWHPLSRISLKEMCNISIFLSLIIK
jgi:hypothetical protein